MKHPLLPLLCWAVGLASCGNPAPRAIDAALLQRLRQAVPTPVQAPAAPLLDTAMTYRVPTSGITDQDISGLCWYYSTCNILRAEVMQREGWKDFYFSQTYGQFYDLLEKSNRFLENVLEYRSEGMDSRMNTWLFNKPSGDGGHFMNAAHLIDKYGIVPAEAMPATFYTTDDRDLMKAVRRLMRKWGLVLRESRTPQEDKAAALEDVWKLLTATLGTPPEEFVFQGERYTPQSFRDRFVPHRMEEDYVVFMNDPTLPYGRRYAIRDSRNCVEYAPWTFVNAPMEVINQMGINSLRGNKMFYISADTDKQGLAEAGVYDLSLAGLDTLAGIDLRMSKEEMIRSVESTSLHAMAVAGVRTHGEAPAAWLIENSFGTRRGADGFVVMSASWMDTYLFRQVVEKTFVNEEWLQIARTRPTELPSWHPGY